MLVLDFKFKYFFFISYHLLVNFCRKWITVEPVSNQDEFGHGLRISKGGKPKRSVQASADSTGEISVSKPPLPTFDLLRIIYIYKKELKKENEETKENATELAFRYESKYESTCFSFLAFLLFFFTKLTFFSLFFFRKMKETNGAPLHRSLYSL